MTSVAFVGLLRSETLAPVVSEEFQVWALAAYILAAWIKKLYLSVSLFLYYLNSGKLSLDDSYELDSHKNNA